MWCLLSSPCRQPLFFLPHCSNLLLLRPFSHSSLRSTASSSSPAVGVVDILEERGVIESLTSDALRSPPPGLPLKPYCDFDPTAQSLHLGNLLAIVLLSWFQRCGHPVVALIGDPFGKSLERPELDAQTLQDNTLAINRCVTDILSRAGGPTPPSFQVLNNYDWWKDVNLLDFLKWVGRYACVGTMMSKESIKKRLEWNFGSGSFFAGICN